MTAYIYSGDKNKYIKNTTAPHCSGCTSKVWKYLDMTEPNLAHVYFWASSFCFRAFETLLHRMTTTSSKLDTMVMSFPNKAGAACWDEQTHRGHSLSSCFSTFSSYLCSSTSGHTRLDLTLYSRNKHVYTLEPKEFHLCEILITASVVIFTHLRRL